MKKIKKIKQIFALPIFISYGLDPIYMCILISRIMLCDCNFVHHALQRTHMHSFFFFVFFFVYFYFSFWLAYIVGADFDTVFQIRFRINFAIALWIFRLFFRKMNLVRPISTASIIFLFSCKIQKEKKKKIQNIEYEAINSWLRNCPHSVFECDNNIITTFIESKRILNNSLFDRFSNMP